MRALVVTKFLPAPATDGGRMRNLAFVELLGERGDVTVCGFSDPDSDPSDLVSRGIEVVTVPWKPSRMRGVASSLRAGSISAGRFWNKELAHAIARTATREPIDLLKVEYTQMLPYSRGISASRRVLDLHNVESELVRSWSRRVGAARPVLALEARLLARAEARARRDFDAVLVVSDQEGAQLPGSGGEVLVCPNGWNAGPSLPRAEAPNAAFVGLLGWHPNADAAIWLANEIWPRVRAHVPGSRLLLVGRAPTRAVRELAQDDVVVTGTVPSVRPHLEQARVAVAPLRIGGGSRLKILEALDAGRPVVATSLGAEGLEALVGRGVTVADHPVELADAIGSLLDDPDEAARQGAEGRAIVHERFGWDTTLKPFAEWLG